MQEAWRLQGRTPPGVQALAPVSARTSGHTDDRRIGLRHLPAARPRDGPHLLGASSRPHLPLLRDRWQVVEQSATAVLVLVLAAVVAPWHDLPGRPLGAGRGGNRPHRRGGALAAPSLLRLAADHHGGLQPRTRVVSALVAVALAALAVLARV